MWRSERSEPVLKRLRCHHARLKTVKLAPRLRPTCDKSQGLWGRPKREFFEHGGSVCLKILFTSDYLVYTVALATIRPRSVSKFLPEASLRSAPNSCAGDVCLVRLPVA